MCISSFLLATALVAAGTDPSTSAPSHYEIKARFDPKAGEVKADVTITLSPADARTSAAFVIGDRIHLRKIDGGPHSQVSVTPTDEPFKGLNRVAFTFDRPPVRPVTLRFSYDGPVGAESEGLRIDPKDGIEVSFEDAWVPVRPNFSLMFTVDADISGIAADEVAVAQGQVRRAGDHILIHRTFTDIDMPFAALSGLKRSSQPGAEVYARHPEGVLETAFRKNAGPVVAYYSRLFGALPPQSLPERLVVLPRQGAAFARRAYISIPDGAEELKKLGHVEDWMLVGTLAHEFAHAWWWRADPLTEDHWLNESMAEYSSLRFTEATFGPNALKQRIDRKIEPAKAAGPIIGHGRPSKAALYQKGPLLLFGLDAKIGRPAVDRLMAEIGRRPPRTTAEFLAALSKVAGPKAAKDFEAELRAP